MQVETNREKIYRHMAAQYAELDGEALRRELEEMERDGELHAAFGLDRKVQRGIRAHKSRRRARSFALAAACLLLILLAPLALNFSSVKNTTSSPQTERAEDAVQPAAPEQPHFAAETPEAEIADEALQENGSAASTAPETAPEIIPLSFSLPDNLSVESVEEDNGKSIYRLRDTGLNDVVLTMERITLEPIFEGLRELETSRGTVYYKYQHDFSLITFEKDDILYELTCRYDLDTLVDLSEYIL